MKIKLVVTCPECDTEIEHTSLFLTNSKDDVPEVDVYQFEQTSWYCSNCGKTWCIGDIDLIDSEEL